MEPFDTLDVAWHRGGVSTVRIESHRHSYPITLIGQITGGGMTIEPEDAEAQRIPDGGGYLVVPGLVHRVLQDRQGPCTYRWAHLSITILGTVEVMPLLEVPQPTADGAAIGRINTALTRLQAIADPLKRAAERKRLAFALLEIALRRSRWSAAADARLGDLARLAPVLARMSQAMSQPLGRTALARLAGLSPTRFHAVFARALGCAPMTWLQRQRLRRAQQLLIASDEPIGAVAEAVGYPDQFHFSRLFKRASGQSPRDYRESQRRSLSAMIGGGENPGPSERDPHAGGGRH
jgi:AraC-like DNA-binding protein